MTAPFLEHRSTLFGIAYRMLGSVAEAEDMAQEAYLRWQGQDVEKIDCPKAWLVTTVRRLCLDRLRSVRREREDSYGVRLPELLADPDAVASPAEVVDQVDSLTTAFTMMLERLSPVERAALLLREVFEYDYREIAAIVGRTEANCRQLVHRAKRGLPGGAEIAIRPNEQAQRIAQQFLVATSTGRMNELLKLLTEDAEFSMTGGGKMLACERFTFQPTDSNDHFDLRQGSAFSRAA